MNRKVLTEEKILQNALRFLGIITFLGAFVFFGLVHRHEINLSYYITHCIVLLGVITAVFCDLSVRHKNLRFTTIILISIFIALIGAFQQMNVSFLYIIPIYLGYCLPDRKKVYPIIYLNIVMFNISRIFKSFNIYYASPNTYILKNILVSNLVVSLLESAIFMTIAIPVLTLLIKQNTDLKTSLQEKNDATNDILKFCSTATSFHNKYLSVHINGVCEITKIILNGLSDSGVYINPDYYEQIVFSVQFHDIGKIYIDSSILDKKDKLNISEFDLIKEHPARGVELFSLLPKNVLNEDYMRTCKNVIYQHHERLDGTGYPTGTKDISFEAKIVAIADVVDALLSWRPYKPPLTWDSMVQILEKNKSGYSYECIKTVYDNKDKILDVSNRNNEKLKTLLNLSEEDIIRK